MISINCSSDVVTLKGVALRKCNPLPVTVAVIPCPLIASKAFFKPARIDSAETFSALFEEVASGLIKAMLALVSIAT